MMFNYNFAKFIDKHTLEYAPHPIIDGENAIFTNDPSIYGYKPIIKTERPKDENYDYTPYYKETKDNIVMDWEQQEKIIEPTEIDRIEAQVLYTAIMTDTLLGE